MPKGFEAGDLYGRSMQLLEALHIVYQPNAAGQLVCVLRLKAQGQHFLDAFLDPLLDPLLDRLFREILHYRRFVHGLLRNDGRNRF